MPNEQHFSAWPLITTVISRSPGGAYTARVKFPHAPVRILKRGELPLLRREVIANVRQWTNDEWHKPVRLQVEDPDGRWVLGIPREGPIVELDTIAPVEPPALHTVSPPSPLPAAAPRPRRTPRSSRRFTPRTPSPRASSRRAIAPRVNAASVLSLVVAAGTYALLTSGSAPDTRPLAHTTPLRAAVSTAPPAAGTPAVSTTPAPAATVPRPPARHVTRERRRAQPQRPRARRRAALGHHRAVISHARPTGSTPTHPPSRITPSPAAPARATAAAPPASTAPAPLPALSRSHTGSTGGCAGANCLPVPGNGPPAL